MKFSMKQIVLANLLIASTNAFVAVPNTIEFNSRSAAVFAAPTVVAASSVLGEATESVVEEKKLDAAELGKEEVITNAAVEAVTVAPEPKKKTAKKASKHDGGVFSPVVNFSRAVLGDEKLKKIRQTVINAHSDTISAFVDTSSTEFGDAVLRTLFKLADADGNGTICEQELEDSLQSLGFSWVNEKQAKTMFKRTDKDKNGEIDMDEWIQAAPMTLRVNLIKLAKKNGEDMGLMS